MTINKAILHIIDANSNAVFTSANELNLNEKYIFDYLDKQITQMLKDSKAKKGDFLEDSVFNIGLDKYIKEDVSFLDYSISIASSYKDILEKTDEYEATDIIVVDFNDEDKAYLGVIFISFKESFTHVISYDEDGKANNNIIKYNSILPSGLTRPESYFLIDLNSLNIRYTEHVRHYNGNEYLILSKGFLQCSKTESTAESISKIKKAVKEIASDQDLNTTMMLSKVENYIAKVDNKELSVDELTEEVFSNDLEHKQEFKKKITEKAIPEAIKLEADTICKKSEIHKIKTDTGIEIKFPSEYSLDNDYINFKYNPDGTIVIEITNVTKIIN